jgi:hypothetical protein
MHIWYEHTSPHTLGLTRTMHLVNLLGQGAIQGNLTVLYTYTVPIRLDYKAGLLSQFLFPARSLPAESATLDKCSMNKN